MHLSKAWRYSQMKGVHLALSARCAQIPFPESEAYTKSLEHGPLEVHLGAAVLNGNVLTLWER